MENVEFPYDLITGSDFANPKPLVRENLIHPKYPVFRRCSTALISYVVDLGKEVVLWRAACTVIPERKGMRVVLCRRHRIEDRHSILERQHDLFLNAIVVIDCNLDRLRSL